MNGPVPEAMVLNEARVPGQLTSEARAVAEVLVRTVNEAQLVTLVQALVTWTQYVPASEAWTAGME